MNDILYDIGKTLREAREQRHFDLEYISRELKIRAPYLKAIEDGDFDAIPGKTAYIVGFLRSYANFLHLDADTLIGRYKAITEEVVEPMDFNFPEATVNYERIIRLAAAGIAGVIIVGYGLWQAGPAVGSFVSSKLGSLPAKYDTYFPKADTLAPKVDNVSKVEPAVEKPKQVASKPVAQAAQEKKPLDSYLEQVKKSEFGKNPAPAQAAPVVPPAPVAEVAETPAAPVAQAPAQVQPQPQQPVAQAAQQEAEKPKSPRVVLLAKQETWVKISDSDNKFVLERVMNAGDTYFLPEKKDFIITAGNAEAIDVFLDGKQHTFLGTLKDISRSSQ